MNRNLCAHVRNRLQIKTAFSHMDHLLIASETSLWPKKVCLRATLMPILWPGLFSLARYSATV